MYDAGKIIVGLAIFAALILSPFLYNRGAAAEPPELAKPLGQTCVLDSAVMQEEHMGLLSEWRDEVLRDGDRHPVTSADGSVHEKSLTRTCLGCHGDREKFCQRCHEYNGVQPICWDCHQDKRAEGEMY